jgi:hypothetical protein
MKNPADENLNINVRLIRRVQAMILAHPEAFDMGSWHGRTKKEKRKRERWLTTPMSFSPKTMAAPNCGSACCLAGWTVTLGKRTSLTDFVKKHTVDVIEDTATELLGITEDQAFGLFHYEGKHGSIDKVTAKEAAKLIDDFIANPLMFE